MASLLISLFHQRYTHTRNHCLYISPQQCRPFSRGFSPAIIAELGSFFFIFAVEGPEIKLSSPITFGKDGGLIRECISNYNSYKPTFYPCAVFRHSQRVHSSAAGPLTTALYILQMGRGNGR